MNKYIDAERLRMELEKRLKNVRDYMNGAGMKYKGPKYFKAQGKESAYDALLNTIDSLQQEQQDCHTVEEWMQHIKNSDQLTKDIFSKGPYDVLYDALNHPYQHCYDAIKEFGELCFQIGVNSVKQKQPEVDLEEEIKNYFKGFYMDLTDQGYILKNSDGSVGLMSVKNIARHFYELGKNSKLYGQDKEDKGVGKETEEGRTRP